MCEIFPQVSASFETKYELREKIGQGGMGSVFSAIERSTKRILAIKFFKRILFGDVSAQQHFVQEAKLLAALSSTQSNPNLVTVYGFGTEGDNLYIAFEYVDGVTLRDTMAKGGISTIKEACQIIISMCQGVALLHQKQIVHMDLKPENVMITESGQVKIIDLGISLSLNQRKKTTSSEGAILGTPCYMSPEQCGEEKITYRSDLYSLGVIFYELIAGIPPFIGTTPQVIRAHLTKDPKDLSCHRVLPRSLGLLVLSLLKKDPLLRPRSALYLAGELKKIIRSSEFSEYLGNLSRERERERSTSSASTLEFDSSNLPLAPTVRIVSSSRAKQVKSTEGGDMSSSDNSADVLRGKASASINFDPGGKAGVNISSDPGGRAAVPELLSVSVESGKMNKGFRVVGFLAIAFILILIYVGYF